MLYKVTPPVATPYAIERTQILECVRQSAGQKVVLVRAPAGYGKTTTLLQLQHQLVAQATDCAWVLLDEADNDVSRFVVSVLHALAGRTESAFLQEDLTRGKRDPAEALQIAMSRRRPPFALFIDEMDTVSSPAVLALVAGMVGRLSPRTMLVIGSRSEPDIGLARLRANGQLLEFGPHLLRLSPAETTEFMVLRRGLPLLPDQVADLHHKTEGWITALWLASIALEQGMNTVQFIAGFDGSNTSLRDYFANVVLAAQPEPVREFLLETCIFEELTVPACDGVRGRSDSAQLLAQIENANLFVAASDEGRNSYRCHSLFAEFLRARLQTQPDRWLKLHRAASDWFLERGRVLPAISHALQAGPDARGLELLRQHADGLLRQGRVRLLARWLDSLPAGSLVGQHALQLAHAWAVAFTRGAHAALALADPGAAGPNGAPADSTDFSTLRALLWFMTDRVDEAHERALANLRQDVPPTGFAAAMTAQTLANTHLAKGRFLDARRFADLARQSHGDGPSPFHLALAGSVEGAVDLVQGRLKSAIARLRAAFEEKSHPARPSGSRPFGFPFPGTLLAEALYEAGDPAQAGAMLRRMAPLLLDIALPDQMFTARVLLARVQRACGEMDGELADLEALETAGHRLGLPRAVACARLERAWGLIDRGDFAEADRQIERSGSAAFWDRIEGHCHLANDVSTPAIARARLLIRKGAAGQAIPELKRLLAQAEAAERRRRALKLRILLAEALHGDGQQRAAMRQLGLALEFAAVEGWVQTFVEEGANLRALLRRYAESLQTEGSIEGTAPLVALLRRVIDSRGDVTPAPAEPCDPGLTEKELRVLRLLAGGLSNQAIAERLFVSTSTVRTHLRSVNAKLQAGSRTQAVAIGRRLGLID